VTISMITMQSNLFLTWSI